MKHKFVYQEPMIKMKTLSKNDENAINTNEKSEDTLDKNVKSATKCKECGCFCFIKKKMPKYFGVPPQKIGVVCSKCGETTVISFQEFCACHLIKGNK